jgi:gluconate 5-dehydrogenase
MINVMDAFKMNDKVVVVTGAAGNLGMHFAEGLAQVGAKLAVMDIPGTEERLEELANRLADEYKTDVKWYIINIADEENVKNVSDKVEKDFGKIDGLLNCAGINHHGTVFDYSESDLDRVMHVNIVGTYSCCKWFGKKMCDRKEGSIVNIASMSGYIGNYPPRTMAAYGISKAGVHHLTKCIAAEFGAYNVRVNSISPGFLEKGMSNVKNFMQLTDPGIAEHNLNATPMHRVARADELCGAAVYLLSDASTFTTGIDILIDGGYMLW